MAATEKYTLTIGRRKNATARVWLTPSSKESITVNGKTIKEYFGQDHIVAMAHLSLDVSGEKFAVVAKVFGGGIKGQADALRHGIARAIATYQPEMRAEMKVRGFLTRDSRAKERRKFGLRKARRAPQWSKR
jgi:small subunit ribosomal protein S9